MRLFVIIFFVFTIAGITIFLSTPAIKEFRRSKAIDKEISELQIEARKINIDNDFLKEKIKYLKSDDYKERVAKDRLNLRNPGEKIIVVQPGIDQENNRDKNLNQQNNTDGSVESESLSNVQKWYKFLFGK